MMTAPHEASADSSHRAAVVTVAGVGKTYPASGRRGRAVQALDEIHLSVGQGEFVTLVGPSGCGKSTLLRIISGLDRPDGGRIEAFGKPVERPGRQAGLMFQSPTLLPWRTAIDNVRLPVEVEGGKRAAKAALPRARQMLEMVRLEGFEDSYPSQLSGGMQQRVALARVLMNEPKLLLLDEPFGALDELTRDQLDIELLRITQERRTTVVMVTHSVHEAVLLSDRVVVFSPRPGRILADIDVKLPRPRDSRVLRDPLYQELVLEIRRELGLSEDVPDDMSISRSDA
jgi:NitT/TauT family transport system ATP-binding protein